MTWQGIEGHDAVVEQFRTTLKRGRLASSFLFVGPSGIGKRTFALELARSLLCDAVAEEQLAPCGKCGTCRQMSAGSHPDLELVSKPADKSYIPLELLIGSDERRMREGLCYNLSSKPMAGGRKIAIIDDADYLNAEGANSLLKTLEEPPPRALLILIGTSEQKQLPTIRSRCQVVRFQPLDAEVVARLLKTEGLAENDKEAQELAALSGGSLDRARILADPEVKQLRGVVLTELGRLPWRLDRLRAALLDMVKQASDDTALRRAKLRQAVEMTIEFFRQAIRAASGAEVSGDSALQGAVESATRDGWLDDGRAAACLERCLEALAHVDSNVYPAILIECWLDELIELGNAEREFV